MGRVKENQQFPHGHRQPSWPGSDLWDSEFNPIIEVPFLLPMTWIGDGGGGAASAGGFKPRDKCLRYCRGQFPKSLQRAELLLSPVSSTTLLWAESIEDTVPSTRESWDITRSL